MLPVVEKSVFLQHHPHSVQILKKPHITGIPEELVVLQSKIEKAHRSMGRDGNLYLYTATPGILYLHLEATQHW